MDQWELEPRAAGRDFGRRHLLGGLVTAAGATLVGCTDFLKKGKLKMTMIPLVMITATTGKETTHRGGSTTSRRRFVSPGFRSRCGRSVG